LIQHTESWARQQGCKAVNLRTNVVRKDAHAFYESLGYNLAKTQHAYRKEL
jgi:GNAT superfamily N-acetyltransferase